MSQYHTPNAYITIQQSASSVNTVSQRILSPPMPVLPPPHSPHPIPVAPPYETDLPQISLSRNKKRNKRVQSLKIKNVKDVKQYISTHDCIGYNLMESFVSMNHITLKKINVGSTTMYQTFENTLWIIARNQYIKLQTALSSKFNTCHEMHIWKQEVNKYDSINDVINIIFEKIESNQSNVQQLKCQLYTFLESIKNHNWKFKTAPKLKWEHVKTKERAIEFIEKNKTINKFKMDTIINKYNILKEIIGLTDMYKIGEFIWMQYGTAQAYCKVTEQLFKGLRNARKFDRLMFIWKSELKNNKPFYIKYLNRLNMSNIINMINNYAIDGKRNNAFKKDNKLLVLCKKFKNDWTAKCLKQKHEEAMRNFYANVDKENGYVDEEKEKEKEIRNNIENEQNIEYNNVSLIISHVPSLPNVTQEKDIESEYDLGIIDSNINNASSKLEHCEPPLKKRKTSENE